MIVSKRDDNEIENCRQMKQQFKKIFFIVTSIVCFLSKFIKTVILYFIRVNIISEGLKNILMHFTRSSGFYWVLSEERHLKSATFDC